MPLAWVFSGGRLADATYLPGALHVGNFRRSGRSDRETLAVAFNAWARSGGDLIMEPGRTYDLGRVRSAIPIYQISGLRNATLHGNGAIVRLNTSSPVQSKILEFSNFNNLRISNLAFVDAGYDPWQDWKGAFCILANGNNGPCDGLDLYGVTVTGAVGGLLIYGSGHRVRGVTIDPSCRFDDCYYGLNCMENGDDVTGGYSAANPRRAYFVYGVAGHELAVQISHNGRLPSSESCCLIKRYARDTHGIRLALRFSGALPWRSGVTIEHQPVRGSFTAGRPSVIDDIHLSIEVLPSTFGGDDMARLAFRSYHASGREELQWTDNVFGVVGLSGNLGRGPAVVAHVKPRLPGSVVITAGTRHSGAISAPGFRIHNR